jgi:hypothetical protein
MAFSEELRNISAAHPSSHEPPYSAAGTRRVALFPGQEGIAVTCAHDGEVGARAALTGEHAIVVLDVALTQALHQRRYTVVGLCGHQQMDM